ncbi:MAG: hypothetical protein OEL56_01425 [Nitrosopumilus sp.]|nr:hypothetical protein [Nitrosopumilus sp.]MDH3515227.1 hypothetical protein [Nitrosopumilus sp.]MDH3564472.1 hypothetical protein [Nitrosopumilus sp.]MDH5418564.1 hypothetical protein [Nitrosopumilus sp.]MDH5554319.1 hypothetical protein [Nitrosopumilus sp.]
MTVLSTKHIQELETACQELSKEDQVRHVGVINSLGNLVAGGFKKGITRYWMMEIWTCCTCRCN